MDSFSTTIFLLSVTDFCALPSINASAAAAAFTEALIAASDNELAVSAKAPSENNSNISSEAEASMSNLIFSSAPPAVCALSEKVDKFVRLLRPRSIFVWRPLRRSKDFVSASATLPPASITAVTVLI